MPYRPLIIPYCLERRTPWWCTTVCWYKNDIFYIKKIDEEFSKKTTPIIIKNKTNHFSIKILLIILLKMLVITPWHCKNTQFVRHVRTQLKLIGPLRDYFCEIIWWSSQFVIFGVRVSVMNYCDESSLMIVIIHWLLLNFLNSCKCVW